LEKLDLIMKNDNPSDADPFGQIADEFVEALRQGKRPSVEEFAQRYPEQADEIREMLPALALMEKAKSADDSSGQEGQALGSAFAPPLQHLGDYQILREVGRGGMGVVYEAQQLSLGRHVAIKVLPAHALLDARQLGRFQREARSAAKLHHTNIVPVFGVGEQNGLHYYVMRFIKGLGLEVVLDELRRLRRPGGKQTPTQAEAQDRPTNVTRDLSVVDVARGMLSGHYAAEECVARPESAKGVGLEQARPSRAQGVPHDAGDPTTAAVKGERASDSSFILHPSSLSSGTIHLPGQSGGSTLSETGSQYWQSVARIGMQVADALAHASGQGVLHRDIKPSNLLLDETGNVWVTDFGLAKGISDVDNLTHTGDIVGTMRYMAPERFSGRGDLRSDVYSLGLTLYELLGLRPAFNEADRNKLIKQVMHDEPVRPRKLNPQVPRDLETVVLKAIARDPAHRYQTPAEMADDLKRFVEDRPVKARRISGAERLWRWCRRNKLMTAMAAAVVLALVAGTTVSTWKYLDAKQQRQIAEEKTKEAEAYGLVQLALNVDTLKLPPIIEKMAEYRQWTDPMLREIKKPPQRLHASLALLPADPSQVDFLFGQLLGARVRDEFPVIRDALAPHKDRLLDKLWAEVEKPEKGNEAERLRAAAALAKYDPDSERWTNRQPETIVFLSTLQERDVRVERDWFRKDGIIGGRNLAPAPFPLTDSGCPIVVDGAQQPHSLFTHPPDNGSARVFYGLDRPYSQFLAKVGVPALQPVSLPCFPRGRRKGEGQSAAHCAGVDELAEQQRPGCNSRCLRPGQAPRGRTKGVRPVVVRRGEVVQESGGCRGQCRTSGGCPNRLQSEAIRYRHAGMG
jgi:serine/threonine protein kinase